MFVKVDLILLILDVPNSGRGLLRLSYRQEWNAIFLKYIKDLDAKKPIIYTGDLNCAHLEIGTKQTSEIFHGRELAIELS